MNVYKMLAKNLSAILEFLLRSTKKYNVNQIARELRISVGSAHKILKKLEKKGLVSSIKMGNATYYSLNLENREAMKICEIALIEDKYRRLNENHLAQVYAKDIEKIEAEAIILFGSILIKKDKAKDVDALFLIKDKKEAKVISNLCLEKSKIKTKVISPLIMLKKDLINEIKKRNEVSLDILKTGIVLRGEDILVKIIKVIKRQNGEN